MHLSGDGGASWIRANPVPRLPPGAEKCYGPEVAIDDAGTVHYLYLGLAGRGNVPMGAFLTASSDRGRSFGPPRRVLGANAFQVRMALDRSPGGSERIHLVWLQAASTPPLGGLPPPPNPIMAMHSDDRGRTFSKPVQVNAVRRERVVAPAAVVGREGELHVAYYDLVGDAVDYHGLEGPAWKGQWSLVVSTSRDGGRSFRHELVDDAIVPPERVMLIFTMPPPAFAANLSGRRVIAWTDARRGDSDVFLRRSGEGGRSWTRAVRLNDDTSGRTQYLPRLGMAESGRVDAIFYDRRGDPEDVRNDVFLRFSNETGSDFSRGRKVTSEPSDSRIGQTYPLPSAEGLVEFGSRLGLASQDRAAVAAWTDTRNALTPPQQDIFSVRIAFPAPRRGLSALAAVLWAAGLLLAGILWRRSSGPRRSDVPAKASS